MKWDKWDFPRWNYFMQDWIERTIRRAKSLVGTKRTKYQEAWLESNANNPSLMWDYYLTFGIHPESQSFIDETIRSLEKLKEGDLYSNDIETAMARISFSIRMMKGLGMDIENKEGG